jgi:hypothetical protein
MWRLHPTFLLRGACVIIAAFLCLPSTTPPVFFFVRPFRALLLPTRMGNLCASPNGVIEENSVPTNLEDAYTLHEEVSPSHPSPYFPF